MKTIFMPKTYVIASLMKIKKKYFNESFVTFKELNIISNKIQTEFNEQNINAIITDNIDKEFYKLEEVIVLNNTSLEEIETASYYCSSDEVMSILWSENFICKQLIEIKQDEIALLQKVKNTIKVKEYKKVK